MGKIRNEAFSVPIGSMVGLPADTKNVDQPLSPQFLMAAWARIGSEMRNISERLYDQSRPVDELQCTEFGGSASSIEVLPDYEINERIEFILVGAPPTAVCTLQLGDRLINLVIPASGIITMGPMGMRLDRNSRRILTSATPGPLLLELMGHADDR